MSDDYRNDEGDEGSSLLEAVYDEEHLWRLKKWRAFVADMPEKAPNDKPLSFNMNEFVNVWDCGTAVCGAGAAALVPEFKEKGLFVRFHESSGEVVNTEPNYEPTSDNFGSDGAAAAFLGMSHTERDNVFFGHFANCSMSAITRDMLLEQIDLLIADREKVLQDSKLSC